MKKNQLKHHISYCENCKEIVKMRRRDNILECKKNGTHQLDFQMLFDSQLDIPFVLSKDEFGKRRNCKKEK